MASKCLYIMGHCEDCWGSGQVWLGYLEPWHLSVFIWAIVRAIEALAKCNSNFWSYGIWVPLYSALISSTLKNAPMPGNATWQGDWFSTSFDLDMFQMGRVLQAQLTRGRREKSVATPISLPGDTHPPSRRCLPSFDRTHEQRSSPCHHIVKNIKGTLHSASLGDA